MLVVQIGAKYSNEVFPDVAVAEAGFEKLVTGIAETDDNLEVVAVDGPGLLLDRIYAAAIAA